MGSPMPETEFARLIEDAALSPRQRLKEFWIGPNELPSPCLGGSIHRVDQMITLRRKVGDPFFGIILKYVPGAIGPQRVGMNAKCNEAKSHLNQALAPNDLEFAERRRRIARGGEGDHLGAEKAFAHGTRSIADFERRIT